MTVYKTTKKEVRAENNTVIGFGYCSIQNVEKYLKRNAYIAGAYGWSCDVYDFDGFVITTGYDPVDYNYAKENAARAGILRKYIKALDAKINAGKIKLPSDWHNARNKVRCMIQKKYDKLLES